jgi:GntR family transcriptional regulator, transcriptional repressor for pyruvate dehydrogenase complex
LKPDQALSAPVSRAYDEKEEKAVPARSSVIKRAEASDLTEKIAALEQPEPARSSGSSKQNRVELVLEAVKMRLANGTWNPGDRLPNEDELATLLDVSRTPLREAIKILDAAGVLELRRGTGTFVRSGPVASLSQLVLFQRYLSGATPQSLMEVRWLFERSCAELAAQRRTREDLAAMRAAIRDLRQLCTADWRDVVPEICEADKQFHRCIYASSKNELIATISNFVLDMVSPFMTRSLEVGGPFDTIQLHEMLYSMIESGNPGGAREITSMNAVDINLNHFRENLEVPSKDDEPEI